jgi:hypothetical protein
MKYLIALTGYIIAFAIVAAAPAFTLVMQGGDHISKTEEREARCIARLFLQRLEQTRNITPILDELFIAGFSERFFKELDELNYFFDIKTELAPAERHVMPPGSGISGTSLPDESKGGIDVLLIGSLDGNRHHCCVPATHDHSIHQLGRNQMGRQD